MVDALQKIGLTLAFLVLAPAALADSELERLRTENASLKAQLQSLKQSCPAAAAPTAISPAATPPAASAEQPAAAPVPAPASVAAAAPPGYKLVPLNAQVVIPDPMVPPYDHTGCSRGLFEGAPQQKWDVADNWDELKRGQSMAQVEKLLGKEHFDVSGGEKVQWQYGKCGKHASGYVIFANGQLQAWSNSAE